MKEKPHRHRASPCQLMVAERERERERYRERERAREIEREREMEAIRKQASKLREQVAKQQQVLPHFLPF